MKFVIFIYMIKNYSQNALFFIFIINKRQFYCLYFAYNIERLNAHCAPNQRIVCIVLIECKGTKDAHRKIRHCTSNQ